MAIRASAVAGQFYPGDLSECREELTSYLETGLRHVVGQPIGGIVPHAGWVFSGAVAGEVLAVLCADPAIETVVCFGAMHRPVAGSVGVVDSSHAWRTPLGEIALDRALAEAVVSASPKLLADAAAHELEHSIEVQVPFIQHLAPSAKLLPVIVPPTAAAPQVGRVVAEQVHATGRNAIYVGSTDLTHYGPRYRFTPKGSGPDALAWAKEVNDRRLLDKVMAMKAEFIVPEAIEHQNACGSGAVAATIEACRVAGADRADLLRHTTSNEVAAGRFGPMADAVGYAGLVFTRPDD